LSDYWENRFLRAVV